jgi:hypothetical protein
MRTRGRSYTSSSSRSDALRADKHTAPDATNQRAGETSRGGEARTLACSRGEVPKQRTWTRAEPDPRQGPAFRDSASAGAEATPPLSAPRKRCTRRRTDSGKTNGEHARTRAHSHA